MTAVTISTLIVVLGNVLMTLSYYCRLLFKQNRQCLIYRRPHFTAPSFYLPYFFIVAHLSLLRRPILSYQFTGKFTVTYFLFKTLDKTFKFEHCVLHCVYFAMTLLCTYCHDVVYRDGCSSLLRRFVFNIAFRLITLVSFTKTFT